MGVSYSYVNHDKRQYFTCGLFTGDRFSSIGYGHSARALAILLSERGDWRGNRVSVIGDTSDEFAVLQRNGLNVVVDVVLMLIEIDGLDWIEAELDNCTDAFMLLCNLALHLRRPDVLRLLDKKLGAGKWQRAYDNHVKGNTDLWLQKVIEARDRGLRLLV